MTAGLRTRGIIAPWLLNGAMNWQAFHTYVADLLAPALQLGNTVAMDNLPAHNVSGIRERIEAVEEPGSSTSPPTRPTSVRSSCLRQAQGAAAQCGRAPFGSLLRQLAQPDPLRAR